MSHKKAKRERAQFEGPRIVRTAIEEFAIKVLSVGEGDMKISFDKTNAQERKRAETVINDLLRQGYALMVETAKDTYKRVRAFDAKTSEYIVFSDAAMGTMNLSDSPPAEDRPRRGRPRKEVERVPVTRPVTAVARTAGGYDPILPRKIRRGLSVREVSRII